MARQKLLEQAIEAKQTLSAAQTAYITIADIIPGTHIDTDLSRAEFEACIRPYTDRIELILEALWRRPLCNRARSTG
ncbi:MAG: Hsp70 family protein [Candidatus Competibacteraceae bacterium]